jgi:hypothetical protein
MTDGTRPSPDATGLIVERLIERVGRCIKLQEDAEFVPCPKCNGKGYHHGFGEHGHDPDWCEMCGGPGEVYHPDFDTHDPVDVLKDVLAALRDLPAQDDLGLSIDMLDVDRLRTWANNILVYGSDISQWGDRVFVAGKMQQIATGIEKAVRDIGVLRSASLGSGSPTRRAQTESLTACRYCHKWGPCPDHKEGA